jgi:hypothetical protein
VLIDQNAPGIWHEGGGLLFSPRDGFLYLGMGDNDDRANTQRVDLDLFSGVLRIDADCRGGGTSHPIPRPPKHGRTANYFIPNTNPFVGQAGVLEEFFALGLRNPFRITCDPVTGRLFIGDVGEQLREEVDVIEPDDPPGLNFQWPIIEGATRDLTPPYIGINRRPWFDYTHVVGQAVISGYVYRGERFDSELGGKYLFGDNVQGTIWSVTQSSNSPIREYLCTLPNGRGPSPGPNYVGLSSFGLDQSNEIYVCQMSSLGGHIFTLARDQASRPERPFPALLSQTGVFADMKLATPSRALVPYEVICPLWSDGAQKQRWMVVPEGRCIQFSPKGEWQFPVGTVLVKTFELPVDDTDPSKLKRLETRLLVLDTNHAAYGVSYRWRPDNADADLLTNSLTEVQGIMNAPLGSFVGADANPAAAAEEQVFELTDRGEGSAGETEHCRFAWQWRKGDFDIQARISSLTPTDLYAKAGLLVRESLEPGSRQVFVIAFPDNRARLHNQGGYQLEYRANPGALISPLYPGSPQPMVQYPQGWLRMKRKGNVFTAFSSADGVSWRSLGALTLSLPETIRFGPAVASHHLRDAATASFHFPARRLQPWYFPSSEDCLSCHTRAANFVLGVKTRQMNRDLVYAGSSVAENQLRVWSQSGLLESAPEDDRLGTLDRLVPLTETSAPLLDRVRSYLDSNCAHCHRPGGSPVPWDARFDTPLPQQKIVNGMVYLRSEVAGVKVVVPHDLVRSILYQRMNNSELIRMPPLASNLIDEPAVSTVAEWISDLPPDGH